MTEGMEIDSKPAQEVTPKAPVDENDLKVGNTTARLLQEIHPGVKVSEICERGDALVNEYLNKAFKSKTLKKGALPTCVNVNAISQNYCPEEGESVTLAEGDVVKVEMGLHVDGYVSSVGHTVVLSEGAITGALADAICASYFATELVVRSMAVGKEASALSQIVKDVAREFGVQPVEGIMTHHHKRMVFSATPESFALCPTNHDAKLVKGVYSVETMFTTVAGSNILKETPNSDTHIYAREKESKWLPKLKSSKEVSKWITNSAASVFPFPKRAISSIVGGRSGLGELSRNGYLNGWVVQQVVPPPSAKKELPKTVSFKTMVLLTESGVERVTGCDFGLPNVQTEMVLPEPYKSQMLRSVKGKVKTLPDVVKRDENGDVKMG